MLCENGVHPTHIAFGILRWGKKNCAFSALFDSFFAEFFRSIRLFFFERSIYFYISVFVSLQQLTSYKCTRMSLINKLQAMMLFYPSAYIIQDVALSKDYATRDS